MQVKWLESIPGGPKGLGHVHTNRQYYPDMPVKSLVGKRASYQGRGRPIALGEGRTRNATVQIGYVMWC